MSHIFKEMGHIWSKYETSMEDSNLPHCIFMSLSNFLQREDTEVAFNFGGNGSEMMRWLNQGSGTKALSSVILAVSG
jgi:hypothetical protein